MQTSLRYDLSADAYVIDISESRTRDISNVIVAGRAGITGRSALEFEEALHEWIDGEALEEILANGGVARVAFEYADCQVEVRPEDGEVRFDPLDDLKLN